MSRTLRTTGALLALALLGGGLSAATPAAASDGPAAGYIVRSGPGALPALTARVEALGGHVTRTLGIIDALAVDLTPPAAAQLRADPAVREVTEDARVAMASTAYDPTTDPASMLTVTTVTNTRRTWGATTGRGVDVALLDSGVTPVEGLATPGKVVYGPDLSFESQSADTRNLDTFGHGTHMAGIIAGRDSGADPEEPSSASFLGVAPDARIVSVKVADAYGATDVSQVIAGIDWVVTHRNDAGLNIRVLNLSLGTPSTQGYQLDPLAYAAEQAWLHGVVVVVSAGNDGTGTGRLADPAQDPYVIAVGAEQSNGTLGISDDTVPDFSSRGDGTRNPDVVAPGASVQSLRVPGSFLDTQYPGAVLGDRFFRGSGTSQAAAVVSGQVADLLQQRPGLTPDQVKALLRGSATSLPAADVQAQGQGLVRTATLLQAATPAASQGFPRSTGSGSLDRARGGQRLVLDGVELTGETDVMGRPFDAAAHAALSATGTAWTGGSWNGAVWAGSGMDTSGWRSAAWTGTTWSGRTWAGRTWATGTWAGRTWAGQTWSDPTSTATGALTGRTWAGRTWGSRTWAAGGWG